MSLNAVRSLSRRWRRLGLSLCLLSATATWAQTPYIGETVCGIWNFAPVGWAKMNGQVLPISQYEALFALIGTTYGGDGQTNFALPDLRGRVLLGAGSGYYPGQKGGAETVTLTVGQMPLHSHTVALPASVSAGDADSPANKAPATPSRTTLNGDAAVAPVGMAPAAVSTAGGSQPVSLVKPSLTLTCLIATEGIFPSPN